MESIVRWQNENRNGIRPAPAFLGINIPAGYSSQVGLHQSPPPLHRPASECDKLTLPSINTGTRQQSRPVNTNRPPEPPAAKQKQNFYLKISGKVRTTGTNLTQYYGQHPTLGKVALR